MGEILKAHIVITGDPGGRETLQELQKGLENGFSTRIIRIIDPENPLTQKRVMYGVSVEGPKDVIVSYREALRESGYLINTDDLTDHPQE